MSSELNPFYGKTHSPEALEVMSKAKKGCLNPMYNKAKSKEFIDQQSRDKTGLNNPMFGKTHSPTTLAKLTKLVYVYDIENNNAFLGSFGTVECSKRFNIGKDTLAKCLLPGSTKTHKGKKFCRTPIYSSKT